MVGFDGQFEKAAAKQLLTVEDVAKTCGVSTRVIYRWIADDSLPVHRFPGSGKRPILRIDSQDLDHWLGQYRHDFKDDENAANQKIVLGGRRFIRTGRPSSARRRNRLDTSVLPRSRVVPLKGDDNG
jgi:excisionase family DNA binding protein